MANKLKLLKTVVEYLDGHKYFEMIKTQCNTTTNHECIVQMFPIDVNLLEVFDMSVLLGEKILTSPVESSSLFHEVIFEYIKCEGLLPANVTSSQILAKLYITCLPCESFQICGFSDLTKHANYKGLVKLSGLISGFSEVTKYTQSARFICSDRNCDGHFGNHFIRIHVPGASELQTVRSDFTCTFCGATLEETISYRTLSDKMIAEIIPIRFDGYLRKELVRGQMTQAVPVIIRDDLVNAIEIGKSYLIIGICRTDYLEGEITITLEANNVMEVFDIHKEIKSTLRNHLDVRGYLPRSVASIYDYCQSNEWRFVTHMTFHFNMYGIMASRLSLGAIVPPGALIKLRLLLLISLVLPPQENKLHILALGVESDSAYSVMNYAAQFSRRPCLASSTVPLNGKISNTKYPWTPYFIEGGLLPLSSGGICLFNDIAMWKKSRQEQLKSAVSSNKVMIELAPKYTRSLPQMISFPLSCQIWTLYDVSGSRIKGANSRSDVFTGCFTGELSKNFLDSFNIIAFLDDNMSNYNEESDVQCVNFILRKYSSDSDSMNSQETSSMVEADDYEKYLLIASEMETQFSVDAEILLHSYFKASRMARTSGCNGSDVPPTGLPTLMSLAVGIAKLKLHCIITESDAVLAIYIYEEYLTARWGVSVLSVQPQSSILNCDSEHFSMQADVMMQRFFVRLQQFCARVKDNNSFSSHVKSRNDIATKEE